MLVSVGRLLAERQEPLTVSLAFVVANVVDLQGCVRDAVLVGEEDF